MKKMISLLLAMVLVLSLCACTDVEGDMQSDPAKQPQTSVPNQSATGNGTEPGTTNPGNTPDLDEDIFSKTSYTDQNDELKLHKDDVVATFGDMKLTNVQMQIYYWTEVYNFINEYYYYLSYLGFDYTKPLDTQPCSFNNKYTWQQYFIDTAITSWLNGVAMESLARKNGFVLPEAYQAQLDSLADNLSTQATQGGFDSVDAMVQATFGSCVTLSDYLSYMEGSYLGYAYFEMRCAAINPTQEQIEEYYNKNEEKLVASGIKKDGSYTIDVRHILVLISDVVTEMGGSSATEEHWEACRSAAQKIYDAYLAGDQTEELFGQLANEHSDDQGGNVTNGGLYSGVKPGQMVTEFNDWCFDENRQIGDTDLVKTQYGYHVMYFAGREESWITQTREAIVSEEAQKIAQEALTMENAQIIYKNILLADVKI